MPSPDEERWAHCHRKKKKEKPKEKPKAAGGVQLGRARACARWRLFLVVFRGLTFWLAGVRHSIRFEGKGSKRVLAAFPRKTSREWKICGRFLGVDFLCMGDIA